MIKTLRITTIIAAVLAVIFLVLPMVFGSHSNDAVEQFLNSSGVVEKYNMGAEYNAKATQGQVPPLVTQAESFVQYLNPPPKPEPSMPESPRPTIPPPRPRASTAKFSLVGTSVHSARPELSLAFIDEPGKGSRWVRQGGQVEHLTIKEVKDGLIVIQDGQRTFQIATQQKPETSLVESPSPAPAFRQEDAGAATTDTPTSSAAAEGMAMLEEFLESIQANVESGEINMPNMENHPDDFRKMRISDDEAEKLKDLPKEQLSPEPTAEGQGSPQQSTVQRTPAARRPVDLEERLSRFRNRVTAKDETAEPNQVKSPSVRRPARLPSRQRRNR